MSRISNLVRLVRSGDVRYATRYYLDRIHWYAVAITRAVRLDFRYAGRLLHGNVNSRFSDLGAHATHHTGYEILDAIFKVVKPLSTDVLVDVGCGKGRVIVHWLHCGYGRRIVGLELDPLHAARTARQFARFGRVQIIAGDAIANIPADGTLFYLFNPFTREKTVEFEERVRALSPDQSVRVVYYYPMFLEAFKSDSWSHTIVKLNPILDKGTLRQFCFPVAVIERVSHQ